MDGIVLVDKPEGPTSHDVVRKMRRIFNTRKVGHAGTLDPMATGMLVIGVGRATRLLGYLTQSDKEYLGTIRLGSATTTDDAQGEVISQATTRQITQADIYEALREFRGHIQQRPSAVSAIQVDGKRAYARVRAGEEVELPAREVTIHDCEVLSITDHPDLDAIDIEVRVVCSVGTYTALRRTRSGAFSSMKSLEELEDQPQVIDITSAIRQVFDCVQIDEEQTVRLCMEFVSQLLLLPAEQLAY
ncbi:MAG: tRNA pseudouridine(55) synthase TruB [Actinobacteria bacterium]|nr:tRNA pseudouridine(55) synthase TruB [Actinomycetota bacterium]